MKKLIILTAIVLMASVAFAGGPRLDGEIVVDFISGAGTGTHTVVRGQNGRFIANARFIFNTNVTTAVALELIEPNADNSGLLTGTIYSASATNVSSFAFAPEYFQFINTGRTSDVIRVTSSVATNGVCRIELAK